MPPSGECLSRIAQAAAMVNDFSGNTICQKITTLAGSYGKINHK